tara:strand:- start:201 stop:338 length:138 start_codon:yes stop_codon:yes gene_type:complete
MKMKLFTNENVKMIKLMIRELEPGLMQEFGRVSGKMVHGCEEKKL